MGRVTYTDGDIFYTGGSNDIWGFRIVGPVSLVSGNSQFAGPQPWQIQPNGNLRRIFRQVKLSGQ